MQLSTLASLYWILIFNVLLSTNSNIGTNTGLYSLENGDKIEIFTVENYKTKLFHQPFVWLVEFYAHWCGHCQNFAPIWRKFALDIQDWSPVVRLAAINCAEESNVEVCRQFQVEQYPTLRFFHQFSIPNDGSIGEVFPTLEDLNQLRTNLVEKLSQEQEIGRGTTWPLLNTTYSEKNISALRKGLHPSTRYIILIIEPQNATIGRELVLDFQALKQITVKFIKDTNLQVLNQLRPKFNFQAPSLLVLDRKLSYTPITPAFKSRESFANAIQSFGKRKGIPVPDIRQHLYDKDFSVQYDRKSIHYDKKLLPPDKVYYADLENTLHYILNHEIAVQVSISGEKLTALRDFFRVVLRYFPLTQRGRVVYWMLLQKLHLVRSNISGRKLQEYAYALERIYKPYSHKLEWIRCKGSSPTKRGYPCGLWTLFHTLTMIEMKITTRSTVLPAMLGFVKYFFSCGYCSKHFHLMARKMNMNRVADSTEAVLWLWRAHNLVNQRLAGDASEDPNFPKVIYPKLSDCPECYVKIGRNGEIFWNYNAVLRYLRRIYEQFLMFS